MTNNTPQTPKLARFFGAIPKAFWYVFLAYIVFVLVVDVAVAPFISYQFKWSLSSLNYILLPLALVAGVLSCGVFWKLRLPALTGFLSTHGFAVFVGAGSIVLLIIQAIIVKGAYFLGTDADWSIMLLFDDPLTLGAYYSIYPNNHFLGGIFAAVYHLGQSLGVDYYLILLGIDCVLVTASVAMAAFVARKIGGTKCGIATFLFTFLFVGLSPHFLVPYTDVYGLFLTTIVLCLYVCWAHPAKWPVMALFSYLGYNMKPTALAVFVGAALVSACLWLKGFLTKRSEARRSAQAEEPANQAPLLRRAQLITFGGAFVASLVAVALAAGIVSITRDQVGVRTYPDEAAVPAHYLMMGFNLEYDGMFNAEDRAYSWQFHTPEEMTEADLAVWRERVQELGPSGLVYLMVKKTVGTFNNGDFLFPRTDPVLISDVKGDNPLIQQFFGIIAPEDRGDDTTVMEDPTIPPSPWAYIAQLLWLMTLAGIVLNFFQRKPTGPELAIAVALLLLSGFLLLFECRPRYLYLYAPFFVILGLRGWQTAGHAWKRRKALKNHRDQSLKVEEHCTE